MAQTGIEDFVAHWNSQLRTLHGEPPKIVYLMDELIRQQKQEIENYKFECIRMGEQKYELKKLLAICIEAKNDAALDALKIKLEGL